MDESGDGRSAFTGAKKMLPNATMVEAIMKWKYETVWRTAVKLLRVQANPTLAADIDAERARLSSLTYTQLCAEYETAQGEMALKARHEADAREAQQPFNLPRALATKSDYDYWCRMDSWTIDELLALLLERAPDRVRSSEILAWKLVSPFAEGYAKLRELAVRSQKLALGQAPVPRDTALEWAIFSGIPVPAGLSAALADLLAIQRSAVASIAPGLPAPEMPTSQIDGSPGARVPDDGSLSAVSVEEDVVQRASAPAQGEPQSAPRFSMKKHAMVERYRALWPTIESDMSDASKNGLKAAKAGARDWDEQAAIAWAKSKGKFKEAQGSDSSLQDAMRNLAALPSRKHRLDG